MSTSIEQDNWTYKIANRAADLCDLNILRLRRVAAESDAAYKSKLGISPAHPTEFANLTKGELVKMILINEFTDPT